MLIIDDPVKGREEAESQIYRSRAWDWFENVAITRLAPGAITCLIQTRWHTEDLAGQILSRPSPLRWRVLTLPAIAGDRDPLGRQPGEELPSVRGREPGYFTRLRAAMTPYVFSALYQQSPTAAEGNFFRRQSFRYWRVPDGLPHPARVLARRAMAGAWIQLEGRRVDLADPGVWRFATCDLAASERTSADWTVIAVWCIDREGDLILLDRARARVDMEGHFALAGPLRDRWGYDLLYVPREYWAKTLIIDARRAGVPVAEVVTDSDKITRAVPAAGRLHAGKAWWPSPQVAPWLQEWEDECVVGSTMILTRLGLVPAAEIKIGDEVLTHRGRFRPVTAVSSREADDLVTIRSKSMDPLIVTPNHPVYAMSVRRNAGGYLAPAEKGWIPAGDVSCRTVAVALSGRVQPTGRPHHAVTFPILEPEQEMTEIDLRAWFDMTVREPYVTGRGRRSWRIIDDGTTIKMDVGKAQPLIYRQLLDYRFGRVCGLYLAEGSYSTTITSRGRRRGCAYWSFHKDETALAEEVRSFLAERWGIGCHVNSLGKANPNGVNLTVSLVRSEAFFDTFGRGAANKRIPWWAWDAPLEFVDGLISGWLDGDGNKTPTGWVGATVSPHLAWGIRALATRQGRWASLRYADPRSPSMIKGRQVRQCRGVFTIGFLDKPGTTSHVADDEHVGLWVKEVIRSGGDTVYNFTVAEDESYVTTGGTVHNCAAFPKGAHDDQVDTFSAAARVAAAHWVPAAPPGRKAAPAPELEQIQAAYAAATGNGSHEPDLLTMKLG